MAVFEHLQQDVEEVRVRLLDLVEQDDRVRVALHLLGELTAFFVPDVSGRRADQLGDRVLLHVLRHVEADERVVAAEEEVGERAGELGLADAGRTEEHEAADRPVRVLEAGARAANGARERRNRLLLRDDALVQRVLHVQQLVAFVLIDRRERHAGPLRDDLVDLGLADDDAARARLDVELLAHELQVLARLDFLLAIELRLLEVLLRDGGLHLLDGDADALVDLAEFLAVARLAQLGARAGLVHEVDRLVGQEPIGDVAARLIDRRLDRLGRVLDVMERLVAVLDAEEHLDRLALGRRIDLDRLEPAFERAVLLDVLPVLGRRRRADAADLAARERRLEDVGGVERAFGRPGADERVQLVDEHDDVRVLGQLLHDRLEALFELTAVLRAGDDERDVQREDPLVGEEVRHVAVDDLLRQAFDDRRLANARLADEHGVVLGAAAEDLLHALDFDVAADERVELVLHRRVRQVAAELGEERRFLHPRERRLLVQERDDVLAHGVEAHPLFHEDGRRDRALLAQDAQEQVLGPDVVVQQAVGFLGGVLQDALGFGAEGDFDRGRDLLAKHGPAFDFLANAFEGEVRAGENAAGQTLALANQPEEEMLGLNRDAAELTRLVPREEKNPPRSFRIAFEHPGLPMVYRVLPDIHYTTAPARSVTAK